MPKLNERKADAYRERLSIPISTELLESLKRFAERRGVPAARAAREMIEAGVKVEG